MEEYDRIREALRPLLREHGGLYDGACIDVTGSGEEVVKLFLMRDSRITRWLYDVGLISFPDYPTEICELRVIVEVRPFAKLW